MATERSRGGKQPKRRGRRPREFANGRQSILTVAQRHFAAYGFEGVSLRGIAREADVDIALIIRTFQSKLGLWKAIIEELADDLNTQQQFFVYLSGEAAVQERLAAFVDWFTERCVQKPFIHLMVFQESLQASERCEVIAERLLRPLLLHVTPVLQDAINEKLLPRGEIAEAFLLVLDVISVQIGNRHLLTALRGQGEGLQAVNSQAGKLAKDLLCQKRF